MSKGNKELLDALETIKKFVDTTVGIKVQAKSAAPVKIKAPHLLTDPKIQFQGATYVTRSNGICNGGRVLFLDCDDEFAVCRRDPGAEQYDNMRLEKLNFSKLKSGDIIYMANESDVDRRFDILEGFYLILNDIQQVHWTQADGVEVTSMLLNYIWKVIIT